MLTKIVRGVSLISLILTASCSIYSITPTAMAPGQKASPVASSHPSAIVITPEIIQLSAFSDQAQQPLEDANNWKKMLQPLLGEGYRYIDNYVSPDGKWLLTSKKQNNAYLVQLLPLPGLSPSIDDIYTSPRSLELYVQLFHGWSPDSTSFVACGSFYNNERHEGCEYMVIFNLQSDKELIAHTISWASVDTPIIAWSKDSEYVAFISGYSGIWLYNKQGSLINHVILNSLSNSVWMDVTVFRNESVIASDLPFDGATSQSQPSNLYRINPFTSEWEIVYSGNKQFSLVAVDPTFKYLLLEELPVDSNASGPLDIFDLETKSIKSQFVFPIGTTYLDYSTAQNFIAFGARYAASTNGIWVFNWETKNMKYYGSAELLGWFPPAQSFLISDQSGNWYTIKP